MGSGGDTVKEGFDKVDDELDNIISQGNIDIGTVSSSLTTHQSSSDHDSRYYTESEIDSKFATVDSDVDDMIPDMSLGRYMCPLLSLPLKNSLAMEIGTGSVTFTRAFAGATYIDRYGVVQDASTDVARFESEGLLIEGASENLCLQSEDFSNASWSKGPGLTVTVDQIDGPDESSNTADKIAATGDDYTYCRQTCMTVVDTYYCVSLFCKKGDYRYIGLRIADSGDIHLTFDFDTETFSHNYNFESWGYKSLANGWYRIYGVRKAVSVITGFCGIAIVDSSGSELPHLSSGEYFYVWGAQVEELPFATSYIPTTTAAVTRAKDVCYVTLADNMPNANEDITILADFNLLTAVIYAVNRYIFSTQSVNIRGYVGTSSVKVTVNYNDKYKNLITITDNKEYRVGLVLDDGTLNGYFDGALITTDTPAEITSSFGNYIYIGNSSLFGHISNFRIYDVALTEAEMRIA